MRIEKLEFKMVKFLIASLAIAVLACKENETKSADSTGEAQTQVSKADSAQQRFLFLSRTNSGEALPKSVVPRYQLIDESIKLPSLIAFKQEIISALEKNDSQAILSFFPEQDPDCMTPAKARDAFELDGGQNKFEQMKQFLQENISGGGYVTNNFNATTDTGFVAPGIQYISGTVIGEMCSSRDCGVIAKEGCDLYDTANGQKKSIAHLMGSEIVGAYKVDKVANPNWRRVFRYDGQEGFVPVGKIISELDASISFRKSDNKWKLCAVSGVNLNAAAVEEDNGD